MGNVLAKHIFDSLFLISSGITVHHSISVVISILFFEVNKVHSWHQHLVITEQTLFVFRENVGTV